MTVGAGESRFKRNHRFRRPEADHRLADDIGRSEAELIDQISGQSDTVHAAGQHEMVTLRTRVTQRTRHTAERAEAGCGPVRNAALATDDRHRVALDGERGARKVDQPLAVQRRQRLVGACPSSEHSAQLAA